MSRNLKLVVRVTTEDFEIKLVDDENNITCMKSRFRIIFRRVHDENKSVQELLNFC